MFAVACYSRECGKLKITHVWIAFNSTWWNVSIDCSNLCSEIFCVHKNSLGDTISWKSATHFCRKMVKKLYPQKIFPVKENYFSFVYIPAQDFQQFPILTQSISLYMSALSQQILKFRCHYVNEYL